VHAGAAAGLKIRTAREDDDAALVAVDRETWSPKVSPSARPPESPFFNERTFPENVLVAELDGKVVGWGKIEHPTPMPSSAHVWHVTGLAVDPAFAGRGIGQALMEGLIAEARRRGGRKMTLRVFGPNDRARRLYDRLGFEVEGCFREEFMVGGGEFVDDYAMALFLTRDAT
jgi:ribosomal protein S18 acetylase RimI-like enzyme